MSFYEDFSRVLNRSHYPLKTFLPCVYIISLHPRIPVVKIGACFKPLLIERFYQLKRDYNQATFIGAVNFEDSKKSETVIHEECNSLRVYDGPSYEQFYCRNEHELIKILKAFAYAEFTVPGGREYEKKMERKEDRFDYLKNMATSLMNIRAIPIQNTYKNMIKNDFSKFLRLGET
jgi:hypothetical protein